MSDHPPFSESLASTFAIEKAPVFFVSSTWIFTVAVSVCQPSGSVKVIPTSGVSVTSFPASSCACSTGSARISASDSSEKSTSSGLLSSDDSTSTLSAHTVRLPGEL